MRIWGWIGWGALALFGAWAIVYGALTNGASAQSHEAPRARPLVREVIAAVRAPADALHDPFAQDDVVVERIATTHGISNTGSIVVAIAECGRNAALDDLAVALPFPAVLIVDPNGRDAKRAATLAYDRGKAVYVQTDDVPPESVLAQWRREFARFDGIASLRWEGASARLGGSGIAFFDERGDADAMRFGADGVALLRRDVTIDDRSEQGYIGYMLHQAFQSAHRVGRAVVFARAQGATLRVLGESAAAAASDGITFEDSP